MGAIFWNNVHSYVAAAPPSSMMNSRRFTAQYLPCFRQKGLAHLSYGRRLLRCATVLRNAGAGGAISSAPVCFLTIKRGPWVREPSLADVSSAQQSI
jgi:hypothetical protein